MDTKWHDRFMRIAEEVQTWSKDPSTKVGCVIVNPATKRIISTGYNGFPAQIEDDENLLNDREEKLLRVTHAEANAIYTAFTHASQISLSGAYLYVTPTPPCVECAKLIASVDIAKVIIEDYELHDEVWSKWQDEFTNKSVKILNECNIGWTRW